MKEYGILIALVILGIAATFFKGKSAPTENNNSGGGVLPSEEAIFKALKKVKQVFGLDIARKVEQIFRLETNHFKSGGFRATNHAGMWAWGNKFPYGWSSLKQFVANYPEYDGEYKITELKESAGHMQNMIVFPSVASAMMFLGFFLEKYGGRTGRWKADDKHPEQQESYRKTVSKISTPLVDMI